MDITSRLQVFQKNVLQYVLVTMLLIVMLQFYYIPNEHNAKFIAWKEGKDQQKNHSNHKIDIPFLVVMCQGTTKRSTSNKLKYTKMMLKSAAALTNEVIRFTIFSDSEFLYKDIVSSMRMWPIENQLKLQVDYQPVRYPPGSKDFRLTFKPCSTFRLLLPDLLQHIDAAVYIDTDMIFMQPPENLLQEFDMFNDVQAAGFAQLTIVNTKSMHRYLGVAPPTSVSAGVALFNFTRLRMLHNENFTQITMNLYQQNKSKIKCGDQDILNLFFEKYPSLLYVMQCKWNYYSEFCVAEPTTNCDPNQHGIGLLHGLGNDFTRRFKYIYKAWEDYEISTPIQELMKRIEKSYQKYKSTCKATNTPYIVENKLVVPS